MKLNIEYVNGWYLMSNKKGERRVLAAGAANTVLANAGWPTGKEESMLLWRYGKTY